MTLVPAKTGPLIGALLLAGLGIPLAGCSGGSSGDGSDDMPGSGQPVTALDVQAQVFTGRCSIPTCHVQPDPPHGLDLSSTATSRANLVSVASAEIPALLRVEPYDVANSYLYMKITDDPDIEGDPMPAFGAPLSAAEVALIESWIEQGAK